MAKQRSCCCCFCVTILVILALIAAGVTAFFLWARPPTIEFKGVAPPEAGVEPFKLTDNLGFNFNLRLNISVNNPNYVEVNFKEIEGTGALQVEGEPELGHGKLQDVKIGRNQVTSILFPVEVNYQLANDKDFVVLKYIATKCGLRKEEPSKLNIKYRVKASLTVVLVPVDLPAYDGTADFDCPIPPGTKIPFLDLLLSNDFKNINPSQLLELLKKGQGIDPKAIQQIVNMAGNNLPNNIPSNIGDLIPH